MKALMILSIRHELLQVSQGLSPFTQLCLGIADLARLM